MPPALRAQEATPFLVQSILPTTESACRSVAWDRIAGGAFPDIPESRNGITVRAPASFSAAAVSGFVASAREQRRAACRTEGRYGMVLTRIERASSMAASRPKYRRNARGAVCPPPTGPQTNGFPSFQSRGGALIDPQPTWWITSNEFPRKSSSARWKAAFCHRM